MSNRELGETKAIVFVILFCILLGWACVGFLGYRIGNNDSCDCPPPPDVKICRIPLPPRQLNGIDDVLARDGGMDGG